MISARKEKHLDATTMLTYSHANTPLSQSERAYYLSYFIKELRSDLRTFDTGLQCGQSGLTKDPLAGQGAFERSGHFL